MVLPPCCLQHLQFQKNLPNAKKSSEKITTSSPNRAKVMTRRGAKADILREVLRGLLSAQAPGGPMHGILLS